MNWKFRLKVWLWRRFVQLFRAVLGRHLKAFVAEGEFGTFAVDPEDAFVGGSLLRRGVWGKEELERLFARVQPESKVLVVGAHIGSLAIPLAKRSQKLVALEPNPRSFELLEINRRLNGLESMQCLEVAASDQEGSLEFLQSRVNSGGSKRVPVVADERYTYDAPDRIQVRAARLDDVLEPQAWDLVVMDIEGSEYFALGGMQGTLARTQALQIEFLPHHLRKVAGVGIHEFLDRILPHFNGVEIPSRGETLTEDAIRPCLVEMFEAEEEDEGLVFFRTS